MVKLASEVGFTFAAADYEAALRDEVALQHAAGELDEQQLDVVAGGASGSGGVIVGSIIVPSGSKI